MGTNNRVMSALRHGTGFERSRDGSLSEQDMNGCPLGFKILLLVGMVLPAGTKLWHTRLRLPPIRVARRYGVFMEESYRSG